MQTPEAVVFDIGNVLIEWQPERYYDAVLGEARREALFDAVDLHAMNERIDAGAPFRETVYATAAQHPMWEDEIRWWHDRWAKLAAPRIEHSITLLRRLRAKGVPVFALTNFGDDTFAYAQTQYDFLAEFDRAYVSARMGVTKPAPVIYQMLEADCGIAPEGLLFTDDRLENIEAAAARGWQTHHFTHPQGWADRLVAAQLLTDKEAMP
ncbi:HAD family phosphatase (plasmid) [Pseudorhodobacter turbinis]|uniref:HAD family phosphatase n=1 Tax=Pseudorhodobacter turbinis TaxID=2500533 RepID=A0A4P8EJ39_9RHOB|nr:HAD family phosphatase [Pseudorhodobacter turbinis]QCO56997.1 HAD family phosphatase [Pseudorhodobacter turbinis]